MADALFSPLDGERVLPGPSARGPWTAEALHGGPVAALLGGAAETLLEDLHPARVTVELLRPAPVAPLRVGATLLRPGRKVRLVSAQVATDGGTVVATATVLGIRRADVPAPASDAPPAPPLPGSGQPAVRSEIDVQDDYDAFHNVGVEHRFVRGGFHERGPATDWIRLRVPVVEGRTTSPLQRVLAAADFGNGVSALADFTSLLFINPDLTVHLHRLPAGEWVCLEAATRLEQHGVGLAQSLLWDEAGPLGHALQSLLIEGR
jgi:hypothetical protein